MSNNLFDQTAYKLIEQLAIQIEDQDSAGLIEVDFHGDVLHLTTTQGIFIINKHSAAQEVWLASPISGPHHFAYKNNKWFNRHSQEFIVLLMDELNQLSNINLNLK